MTREEKRQRLLDMANVYNVPIIEEDYHRDFDYAQKCPPSLYALDNNRLVIYVSTFTLTFPYMMKIGYTVGPADFIDMLGYALEVDETAVGGIGQYFLNDYIESGSYERNLRNMREVYCRRLKLLCGSGRRASGLVYAERGDRRTQILPAGGRKRSDRCTWMVLLRGRKGKEWTRASLLFPCDRRTDSSGDSDFRRSAG